MKKILVALVLSTVMLSGCGIFRSNKAWDKAKQENPLEIPPNMDRPPASDALTIPSVNAQHETAALVSAVNSGTLHLNSDVESTYKRVALALSNGDIGRITSQNESEHSYQVAMPPKVAVGAKQGFFQRHFSNTQGASEASSANAKGYVGAGTTLRVQIKPTADGGSTISASGEAQQVSRLLDALKVRLGG